MTLIQLTGKINDHGQLEVELPKGLPTGAVHVTLEITPATDIPWEERPWTDEEVASLSKIEPKTGAEIVAAGHIGGWEEYGITDSVEWIENQRQKRREKREW